MMFQSAQVEIEPVAWRIELVESLRADPHDIETIKVAEPRTVTALLNRIDPTWALANSVPISADTWIVIWMPPSQDKPESVELSIEQWLHGAKSSKKEVDVRADVRTVRVVWTERRAVIYASEGDIASALDAVVRFSVAQQAALALEESMRSAWATIESDLSLTHALSIRDLKMQGHVNDMTEVTTYMKIGWLRILRCLEQLEPTLSDPSRRIFAELASAASLYDRLETL